MNEDEEEKRDFLSKQERKEKCQMKKTREQRSPFFM
jgi:hypothetical protein